MTRAFILQGWLTKFYAGRSHGDSIYIFNVKNNGDTRKNEADRFLFRVRCQSCQRGIGLRPLHHCTALDQTVAHRPNLRACCPHAFHPITGPVYILSAFWTKGREDWTYGMPDVGLPTDVAAVHGTRQPRLRTPPPPPSFLACLSGCLVLLGGVPCFVR